MWLSPKKDFLGLFYQSLFYGYYYNPTFSEFGQIHPVLHLCNWLIKVSKRTHQNIFLLGGKCWGRGASCVPLTLEQEAHTWGRWQGQPRAFCTPSTWRDLGCAHCSLGVYRCSRSSLSLKPCSLVPCGYCLDPFRLLFRFICLEIPINRHREAGETQKLGKIWPFWVIWICFLRSHRKFKIIGVLSVT